MVPTMKICAGIALLMITILGLAAAEYPQAEITNGLVRATVYLPDAKTGFYRSTRFDWAGTIANLEYKGHTFFAPWFRQHDPDLRDVEYRPSLDGFAAGTPSANIGPVEEFSLPLGYEEAPVGGTFIKLGVGVLRKPEEQRYAWATRYVIADAGKRSVRPGPDSVECLQEVSANGYAYAYRKTIRLSKDKPELILEHSLKNTGEKAIETLVYDHNFLVMDNQPSGPDFRIQFPFEIKPAKDRLDVMQVRGKEIAFARELEKDERSMLQVEGFGTTAADYDLRVENRKTGTGVHITCDRPIERIAVWAIRPTRCPEPFIRVKAEPGNEFTWRIVYEFYAK
jgi:hypothetical protein